MSIYSIGGKTQDAGGIMSQHVLTQVDTASTMSVAQGQTGAYISVLTLDITPKKANSIIQIKAQINHESNPEGTANILFFLGQTIGGTTTPLQAPAAGSVNKGLGLTIGIPSRDLDASSTMDTANICYFDTPNTTSQITYTVGVKSKFSAFTLALNRTITDADANEYERTISYISATEITQ